MAKEIINIQTKKQLPGDMSFDQLHSVHQLDIIKKVKQQMKKYVYGALHGDFEGILYAFDHKQEWFRFNPAVHPFMLKYQRILVDLINYHLAKMIEQHNPVSVHYLLEKVESVAQRQSLQPYREILVSRFEHECFDCGKNLHHGKAATHVDHFIPWSFIQSDNLWNLVLSCSNCNTRKRDYLPREGFLDQIKNRNEILQQEHILLKEDSSLYNYRPQKLELLYEYSQQNGFYERWSP
ncbi:HNH endonuclease [Salibacterium salarium]|uniref:HNH endonuclease n=1 Tax=Salibacterium salarium TaxID=284579 RepID=A0A428MW52_9BACI|nr:HNH endonuclease domain-containing protein [Salibacterium salarium]RSL30378.1 HNH endonuclease [Salibacterium salarium]